MTRDTKARILQRALEIVGSREDLARRINARPVNLAAWLAGVAPVPDDIFLSAVDIVLNHETQGISLWQEDPPGPKNRPKTN